MRLRKDPNAQNFIQNSKYVINEFPINLNKEIILEVGMGKGEMLTELASKNPEKTFIGIEKFDTVAVKAIKKAEKLNLTNFFVICEDLDKLRDAFQGQVEEMWLTFSDPWPKVRHYKRRLTYKTFLDIYKQILSSKGVLKIKTDNDRFFAWTLESLAEYGAKIIYQTNDLHKSEKNKDNVCTGYEIKWSEKGKNINYLEAKF